MMSSIVICLKLKYILKKQYQLIARRLYTVVIDSAIRTEHMPYM